MSNQINKPTAKNYDAGDMYDLASLAECDLDWMSTAITDIRLRLAKLKADLTERDVNAQYSFHMLEKVLEMYEYLAEDRARCHQKQAEVYLKEWQGNEKAVSP